MRSKNVAEVINMKSIFEKINDGEYNSKKTYISSFTIKTSLNNLGQLIQDTFSMMDSSSTRSDIIALTMIEVSKYLRELDRINENNKQLSIDEHALSRKFREDLITEFGTKDNPYESVIFAHAWDQGHPSGYYEVASIYREFADDFKYPPENK